MKMKSYTKKGPGRYAGNGRMEKLRVAFKQLGGKKKLGDFNLWLRFGELVLMGISYSPICLPFTKTHRNRPHQTRAGEYADDLYGPSNAIPLKPKPEKKFAFKLGKRPGTMIIDDPAAR